VGMNRDNVNHQGHDGDVPHTRGDEPEVAGHETGPEKCSPHAWG
jgi:hypothetical protein